MTAFAESWMDTIKNVGWGGGELLVVKCQESPGSLPFELIGATFGSGGNRDVFTGPQPIRYGAPPFPPIVMPPSDAMLQRLFMWSFGLTVGSTSRTFLVLNVKLIRQVFGHNAVAQLLVRTPQIGKSGNATPYTLTWLWMGQCPPYIGPTSVSPFPVPSSNPVRPAAPHYAHYVEDFADVLNGVPGASTTVAIWRDFTPLTTQWTANWYAIQTFDAGDYNSVDNMRIAMLAWSAGPGSDQLAHLEQHSLLVPVSPPIGGAGAWLVTGKVYSRHVTAAQVSATIDQAPNTVQRVDVSGKFVAAATVTVTLDAKGALSSSKS